MLRLLVKGGERYLVRDQGERSHLAQPGLSFGQELAEPVSDDQLRAYIQELAARGAFGKMRYKAFAKMSKARVRVMPAHLEFKMGVGLAYARSTVIARL